MEGWYYLHTNGDLIYKRDLPGTAADIRESDFARHMWPVHPDDRLGAWSILVEALALGARAERVSELAAKWGCDDADAETYAERIGVRLTREGANWCATERRFADDVLAPVPGVPGVAGVAGSKLEALAYLARGIGLRAGKTWQRSFLDLLKARAHEASVVRP